MRNMDEMPSDEMISYGREIIQAEGMVCDERRKEDVRKEIGKGRDDFKMRVLKFNDNTKEES